MISVNELVKKRFLDFTDTIQFAVRIEIHHTEYMAHNAPQRKRTWMYLLNWLIIALAAGLCGPVLVHGFLFGMRFIQSGLQLPWWGILLYACGGALLTGAVVYKIKPGVIGEGVPAYILSVRGSSGHWGLSRSVLKYIAGFITVTAYGNGGIVGPVGRSGSGLAAAVVKALFGTDDTDYRVRTACICGFSAVIASVFHSSIGAGIFSVEIIQRANMKYKDLFPALMASSIAVFICKIFSQPALYEIPSQVDFNISWFMLIPIITLSLATGFLGWLYNKTYDIVSNVFQRSRNKHIAPKVLAATIIAAGLCVWVQPELLGTGAGIVKNLFTTAHDVRGNIPELVPLVIVYLILITVKMLANCLTVGSGLSAGLTSSVVITGLLAGSLASSLLGIDPGSADYFAFLAVGFAGMLGSSMNVPVAASIITMEVFGMSYALPAALAAVIGFQVNRHNLIYDYLIEDLPEQKE